MIGILVFGLLILSVICLWLLIENRKSWKFLIWFIPVLFFVVQVLFFVGHWQDLDKILLAVTTKSSIPGEKINKAVTSWLMIYSTSYLRSFIWIAFCASFFYALYSLSSERTDRSIVFW